MSDSQEQGCGQVSGHQDHKRRLAHERLALGDAWTISDLVWPSQVGTPLGHRALLRHLHGACPTTALQTQKFDRYGSVRPIPGG